VTVEEAKAKLVGAIDEYFVEINRQNA